MDTMEKHLYVEKSLKWQEILDSTCAKAEFVPVLKKITSKSTEIELAHLVLSNTSLYSRLVDWMFDFLDKTQNKSAVKSKDFRVKGNEKFKQYKDDESLSLYTDSIRVAPPNSEEIALAYANRSAVLFHKRQFKECMSDAQRALSLAYPQNLHYKLQLRLARCMLNLGYLDECNDLLNKTQKGIAKNKTGAPVEEIDLLIEELSKTKIEDRRESGADNASLKNLPKEEELPQITGENNKLFPSASSKVQLKYTAKKGRCVVARQPIKQGDVLFVEKPYAFVVLPAHYKYHCHHCTSSLVAPIPCCSCTEALFCSDECKKAANETYHKWECGGLSLFYSLGIAHLALRVVLVTGSLETLLEEASMCTFSCKDKAKLGNEKSAYSKVYSLLPHIEDMGCEDLFQYCMTAMMLTLYLLRKTNFFNEIDKESVLEDEVVKVCALLIRHVAQLICNANAIVGMEEDRSTSGEVVVTEKKERIASAIYPSSSMMNHSCDPNISTSFCRDLLIVTANRDIPVNGEIFNCYGPHHKHMSTARRQIALQYQYFFTCDCTACSDSNKAEQDRAVKLASAFRCQECAGPVMEQVPGREPAGSKIIQNQEASVHMMVCDTCGIHQPISNLVENALTAHSLYLKGSESMEEGNLKESVTFFTQCLELQENCLYRANQELLNTLNDLGQCYAILGDFSKSVQYVQATIPAIAERFGKLSSEVGYEYIKLSDIMLHEISFMKTKPSEKKLDDISLVIEKAVFIYCLHGAQWTEEFRDLIDNRKALLGFRMSSEKH